MSLTGKHILSSDQFDRETLEELFRLADVLRPVARGELVTRILEGAVMGSLFFEASTRTRLSCDSAFMRLGGAVSNTAGEEITSISKGESLADTSRVVTGYYDMVVMRHADEHAVYEFAAATNVPVINGGNGPAEHPTQALLDVYALNREFARLGKQIDGARVALVGDLKYGRAAHSMIRLLMVYSDLEIVCVSPDELPLPDDLLALIEERGHRLVQSNRPQEALHDVDVIYATRLQKERFVGDTAPYSDEFRIGRDLLDSAGAANAVIMHPLPRDSRTGANDLSTDLNRDPRLAIFRQTDAGIPVRMALFASVLGVADQVPHTLRKATWYRPDYVGPDDAPFYRNVDR
jgi:aspartate carbamoyltransferase catalytic subunit